MIITHPFLFNTIVVLFIAFTAGWLVFVVSSRSAIKLKDRMEELQAEKDRLHQQLLSLQEELEDGSSAAGNNTPVISFSTPTKALGRE